MARLPRACVLLGAVLLGPPGCQGDKAGGGPATTRREPVEALVERLAAEPDAATLLAVLSQTHGEVRARVGPHRMRYSAAFEFGPVEQIPAPKVGEPVVTETKLVDELSLEWASEPTSPPAFRLEQHNDADEGREVIVVEEKVYTQLRHRSWFWRELDSELHELWLDDAYHCMHDAIALAAPQLHVTTADGEPVGDRPTLSIALSLADDVDRTLIRTDPSGDWRHRATIESVAGTVLLDQASGAWLSGEVDITYSIVDQRGHKLRGQAAVSGTLEPVEAGDLEIRPPPGAPRLPEGERYEVERAKLLDGLAAP